MSFTEPDDGAPSSGLLTWLRALRSGPSADPIAALQASLAQDARLPRGGGLFGAGYARFMADAANSPAGGGDADPPGAAAPDAAATAPMAAARPTAAAAPADPATLVTSPPGRGFIRGAELNPATGQPYFDVQPDAEHNPTFGYGHKVEPDEQAALQSQLGGLDRQGRSALIDKLFSQDLATAEQRVRDRLGPEALQTLNQAQFDALVADAFNAGGGGALGPKMLQNIWDGDMAAAGRQFNAVRSGNDVLGGLVKRSLQEAAIFNRGDYGYQPAPQEIEVLKRAKQAELKQKRAGPPGQ